MVGKAVRADLKEGKPSLAVIYGMQTSAAVRDWNGEHLRADAPPPDDQTVAELAEELTRCGALLRVRKVVEAEVAEALAALPATRGAASRERLEVFAELLVARDH